MNNDINPFNVALNNASSFKYNASLLAEATNADRLKKYKNSCFAEIFI